MRLNVSTEQYHPAYEHIEKHVLASNMAEIGAPAPCKESPTEEMSDITARSVVQVFSTAELKNILQPYAPGQQRRGAGSGFIVQEKGTLYILTNHHVIDQTTDIEVTISSEGKRRFPVQIVADCPEGDLAL